MNADRFSKRIRILFTRDESPLKSQGAQRYANKFRQHSKSDHHQPPQRCHLGDLPTGCCRHGMLWLHLTRLDIGYCHPLTNATSALFHSVRQAHELQWYERSIIAYLETTPRSRSRRSSGGLLSSEFSGRICQRTCIWTATPKLPS